MYTSISPTAQHRTRTVPAALGVSRVHHTLPHYMELVTCAPTAQCISSSICAIALNSWVPSQKWRKQSYPLRYKRGTDNKGCRNPSTAATLQIPELPLQKECTADHFLATYGITERRSNHIYSQQCLEVRIMRNHPN